MALTPNYNKKLNGKKARRITFCIKENGGNDYLLMSVIEVMEPDMQDYNDFPYGCNPIEKTERLSKTKKYNVCMKMDWMELNENFFMAPHLHYVVGNSPIAFYNDKFESRPLQNEPPYVIKDSYDEGADELLHIFPYRQCSKFLYTFIDKTRYAADVISNNEYLQKQLSRLSLKHYGIDLSLYPDYLGNIYLLQYNPYFRQIDISKSEVPKGLYVDFSYRPNVTGDLLLRISNKNRAGFYSFEKDVVVSTSQSFYFIELPSLPDVVNIKVFDNDYNLIYCHDNMSFVSSININMGVKVKDVLLEHETGKKLQKEKVEKYVSESLTMGKPAEGDVVMGEKMSINAYKMLEQRYEFFFFDGEEKNKSKAKSVIKNILNRAQKRCIICDPYFNHNDLVEYVFTMRSLNVVVRILGSKEFIAQKEEKKKLEAKQIRRVIKEYTSKVGGEIQFKLLTGKSSLHDRFIVVDDDVWLLGASFNAFGSRATTITKVPQEACMHIRNTAEQWWSDDKYSVTIDKLYAFN